MTSRDDLTVGVGGRTQALVQCAVFAVDRHEFGAGGRPQGLHDRPGGDQALLVRQRQALAGPQGPDRHREAGETDHTVDDDVGWLDDVGRCRPTTVIDGSAAATSRACLRVRDDDDRRD